MLSRLPSAGGPQRAEAHLKALAESLKAAVYCGYCQGGRAKCDKCGGKKRRLVTCEVCHGIGWMQAPNGMNNTLVKCTRCVGAGLFPNASCPTCKATGLVTCPLCDGSPWRDGFLGCKACAICMKCIGSGVSETECVTCGGKGPRDGKSSRRKPADVWNASPCNACSSSGWPFPNLAMPCAKCMGLGVRLQPKSDLSKTLD